jgi:alpha-N-arabinofuranosidase
MTVIDPAVAVGVVDERMFGSFVEHMGRAIYGGIFEPGHPTADTAGWRGDVLGLVRQLGVTVIRYPGGNFVSGYDWEDGVGPREARPVRLDLAWRSIEPNLVGTDDFIAWARSVGAEPMLAVNLGTRGIDAARNLVEYCNAPGGSRYADWRVANGHADPYAVHTWCLGNEMDGPWQIGQKTAVEYGRLAAEAGKVMRLVDPTIELVTCGSSASNMPTFGTWEETVLDLAWDVTDHVSVHSYSDPAEYRSVGAYLGCSLDLDRTIGTVVGIADAVGRLKGSDKRIGLSVDEWNVWHMSEHRARENAGGSAGPFRRAPALAEDEHDMADALVVGCLLITLLRHADRVRIACLAQLVNVIPAIRTVDGGPAWLQTSAYPFADVARSGRGTVLELEVDGPSYPVDGEGAVPAIEATAVHDGGAGFLTVFAVNRLDRPLMFEATLRHLEGMTVREQTVLADPDVRASNTATHPDRVVPVRRDGATLDGESLTVELAARSWNVVRLTEGVGATVSPLRQARTTGGGGWR